MNTTFKAMFGAVILFSVSATAAEWYGALAYDYKTGAWGWATRDSEEEAADAAIEFCEAENPGDNCKIVLNFENTCAAFAVGSDNAHGWGTAETREDAEERALAECDARTEGECAIKISSCSEQE